MKKRDLTTCPVVFSLDIFGDRWSLIILRDVLFSGKSHFREFLMSEEKIASNILSTRLEMLVKDGLLTRTADVANKSAVVYKPTKKALDLLPMLIELVRWGAAYNMYVDVSDPGLQMLLDDPETFRVSVVEKFDTP